MLGKALWLEAQVWNIHIRGPQAILLDGSRSVCRYKLLHASAEQLRVDVVVACSASSFSMKLHMVAGDERKRGKIFMETNLRGCTQVEFVSAI